MSVCSCGCLFVCVFVWFGLVCVGLCCVGMCWFGVLRVWLFVCEVGLFVCVFCCL